MFDFKKFRKNKGWTQEVAADLIFGMSINFWFGLENKEHTEQYVAVYGKACELYDKGIKFNHIPDKDFIDLIKKVAKKHGLNMKQMSLLSGHSAGFFGQIIRGTSKLNKRWRTVICTVIYMLEHPEVEEAQVEVIKPENIKIDFDKPSVKENTLPQVVETHQDEDDFFEHVRHIMIDGKPWWIVADICKEIGHSNPSEASKLIKNPENLSKADTSLSGSPKLICNEDGLFDILMGSNLEKAKKIQQRVTELLPRIRKQTMATIVIVDELDLIIAQAEEMKVLRARQYAIEQQALNNARRIDEMEQRISPAKAAEIVLKEAEWSDDVKLWTSKSARWIVKELTQRGSLDSNTKLFSNFWHDHNEYVGVSSFKDVKCLPQAERSKIFTENRGKMLAVTLPEFKTNINHDELKKQREAMNNG